MRQDSPSVRTAAIDYPEGVAVDPHRHRRTQLVYAATGVMTVSTALGAWVVPPERAVWIPGGIEHWIAMRGRVSMRTLYFEPDRVGIAACAVVGVPPLARNLILRAMTLDDPARLDRLIAVLLDELADTPAAPLHLPLPRDRRLLRVAEALLATPRDSRSLSDWAALAAASPRTVERGFRAETGLSFRAWRTRARLLQALRELAAGRSVSEVALDLGFQEPGSFIAMFRRSLGSTPGRFFRLTAEAEGAADGGERPRLRPPAPLQDIPV
jgi:AraC-like DNA-binding protein